VRSGFGSGLFCKERGKEWGQLLSIQFEAD
jgi:hypothetical protein